MGWIPVTDQKPPKWDAVKNPMRGVRFADMEDGTGYLAVRYDTNRYIYEGVPVAKFEGIKRSRCASVYLRQNIRPHYPVVDLKKYETLAAYEADQEPILAKEALLAKQRLQAVPQMSMSLFGPEAMPTTSGKKRKS